MSISRRRFNRLTLLGGASFTVSSGIFFPKPAEAYNTELSLRNFTSAQAFSRLQRLSGADPMPGVLDAILQGKGFEKSINSREAAAIRASDQALVNNGFARNRTELAQAGRGVSTSLLWGRQRQDRVGNNVGYGFVQEYNNEVSSARLSGPTMAGIHSSQPVLADQRLTPEEVAGVLLPVRSTFADLGNWTSETSFTQYRTTFGVVTVRYDILEPGRGGRGQVYVSIEAETMPTRNVLVAVRFDD